MTNYNERLDVIVLGVYNEAYKCGVGARPYHEYRSVEAVAAEAKQAITSTMKELVAEAKPDRQPPMKMGNPTKESSDLDKMIFAKKRGHNEAIDQFEQNLLKALEEV